MNDIRIESINTILDDISKYIKIAKGSEYNIGRNSNIGGILGILTKDFSLYYVHNEGLFYISFFVGTPCSVACDLTVLIVDVIGAEYFVVLEDSFFDAKNKILKYGDEAVHAKYDDHLDKLGKVKCPLCDSIVFKEEILDCGTCVHCQDLKHNITIQ